MWGLMSYGWENMGRNRLIYYFLRHHLIKRKHIPITNSVNQSRIFPMFVAVGAPLAAMESAEGRWAAWGPYTTCSKSCGGGMQSRIRKCVDPSRSHSLKTCKGAFRQRRQCNLNPCAGKKKTQNKDNTKKVSHYASTHHERFKTFNISVNVYYWVDKEIDNRKNRLSDVRLG